MCVCVCIYIVLWRDDRFRRNVFWNDFRLLRSAAHRPEQRQSINRAESSNRPGRGVYNIVASSLFRCRHAPRHPTAPRIFVYNTATAENISYSTYTVFFLPVIRRRRSSSSVSRSFPLMFASTQFQLKSLRYQFAPRDYYYNNIVINNTRAHENVLWIRKPHAHAQANTNVHTRETYRETRLCKCVSGGELMESNVA